MNRMRLVAGSLGALIVVALVSGVMTLRSGEAVAGECVHAETQFGYGEGATCPAARQACKADLDNKLQYACTGIHYTGEPCWVGSISYGTCTTLPNGDKARDCQRDIWCEEQSPF